MYKPEVKGYKSRSIAYIKTKEIWCESANNNSINHSLSTSMDNLARANQ